MATTIWNLMRGLAGLESGRWCRSCNETILESDPFGQSEGVCVPCRKRA